MLQFLKKREHKMLNSTPRSFSAAPAETMSSSFKSRAPSMGDPCNFDTYVEPWPGGKSNRPVFVEGKRINDLRTKLHALRNDCLQKIALEGKRINDLRTKLHALRNDCLQKIAHSRASMTVDYGPSNDGNYDETLRLEKTTSKRKSKLELSSKNEADGDDNEQKPELEKSLTIADVFGASFSNDKISSSSSSSYSSNVADADKDEYSDGNDAITCE